MRYQSCSLVCENGTSLKKVIEQVNDDEYRFHNTSVYSAQRASLPGSAFPIIVIIGELNTKLAHYFIERNASPLRQFDQCGQPVGV